MVLRVCARGPGGLRTGQRQGRFSISLAGLDPQKVLGLVLNETGTDGSGEGYGSYAYIAG